LIQLLETRRLVDIEASSFDYESLSEIGIDPPIPFLVRIGQRTSRNRAAEAQIVEPLRHRCETGLDVPQAFAVRQLSERHCQILIATREAS
jgi:hypothetical protein